MLLKCEKLLVPMTINTRVRIYIQHTQQYYIMQINVSVMKISLSNCQHLPINLNGLIMCVCIVMCSILSACTGAC